VPVPVRSVLVRRLFSLTGVVPLGGFLVLHVAVNARALSGDEAYARALDWLARVPGLRLIEAVLVIAPLVLHAAVGSWLVATRTPLTSPSPYPGAVLYWMRVTGVVALVFVAMHLWKLRLVVPAAAPHGHELVTRAVADLSSTWMGIPWTGVAYLVGTACVTFHFVAGTWGFLATLPAWAGSVGRRRLTAWVAGAAGAVIWGTLVNVVVFEATGARLVGEGPGESQAGPPCPETAYPVSGKK